MIKRLSILSALIIALTLGGCASVNVNINNKDTKDKQKTQAEEQSNEEPVVGMANPWHEISADEAEQNPRMFVAPENASNIVWRALGPSANENANAGQLIELDFDIVDEYITKHFTARYQYGAAEDDDISGMYYDWTAVDEGTLSNWGFGNMKAKFHRFCGDDEMADLCTWYDIEIGISYSLSTSAPDLDGFDIQAVVESMYPGDDKYSATSGKEYKLEQLVILSRHNLRAPLASNGSVPQELTPHEWINWSSAPSELTVKGGILETNMGQYFRKWLDQEGLIAENSIPEPGEIRFYARDKQRCRATARYFASGLLPLADVVVEHPGAPFNTEDFMKPKIHFFSDEFAKDVTAQVAEMGGDAGFEGISEQTRDAISLIMDVADVKDSEGYKSGKYGDLMTDITGYRIEADAEPDVTGPVKTASQVADALILQYYEEPDDLAAAFGHELTRKDWDTIGSFMTEFTDMRHGTPLAAVNMTAPLLMELEGELKNKERKLTFFCAHDCTLVGALTALGAEQYSLPDSIEKKTPIGVKLMFERLRDEDDKVWYRVNLLYRSTDQIRNAEVLSLNNPPLRYALSFKGIETNEDGLISEEDLFKLFDDAIETYFELEEEYTLDAAA